MSVAVADAVRGADRRLERCPTCSEALQDLGDISLCVSCSCGYSDPPARSAPPVPPKPSTDASNVVSLQGCTQCGSAFEGVSCFCGAVYNLPPAETYVATAEVPKLIDPRAATCVECRVPRDLIAGHLVCPACQDAKPFNPATETQGPAETEITPAVAEQAAAAIAPPMTAETIAQVPAVAAPVERPVATNEYENRRSRRKGR